MVVNPFTVKFLNFVTSSSMFSLANMSLVSRAPMSKLCDIVLHATETFPLLTKDPKPTFLHSGRCHNQVEVCSPNPCPGGFECKMTVGSFHCDPLPQVSQNRTDFIYCSYTSFWGKCGGEMTLGIHRYLKPSVICQVSPMIGYMEILEISAGVLGLLLLVAIFICVRKRYIQRKKKKPVCVQDSNG